MVGGLVDDLMNDLIGDLIGGLIGGLIGDLIEGNSVMCKILVKAEFADVICLSTLRALSFTKSILKALRVSEPLTNVSESSRSALSSLS